MATNPQAKLDASFQGTRTSRLFQNQDQNSLAESIQSKLVKGDTTDAAIRNENVGVWSANDPFVKSVMMRSIERIQDSNNILQLLPDMKLAIEIIIGGILSPKDMMSVALTFTSNNPVFDEKSVSLLSVVENYFVTSYKLKDQLSKMLEDILSKTGSYPLAILPETAIDYLINSNSHVTTESLSATYDPSGRIRPIGLIANKRKTDQTEEIDLFKYVQQISTEGYDSVSGEFDGTVVSKELNLTVTDNFDVLKLPTLTRKVTATQQQALVNKRRDTLKNAMQKQVRYSSEAAVSVNQADFKRSVDSVRTLQKLYPVRTYSQSPIQRVKPRTVLDKPTMGHPLVLKLPTEAVIPVYSPNDPTDHLGYFVALDNTGNPCRLSEINNLYRMMSTSSNVNNNVSSFILQNTANGMSPATQGSGLGWERQAFERAIPIYTQMVESELLDRLERGTLGSGVAMGQVDAVYQIMLARAMQGKHTQLLYIPGSLLSYIAVDHDEFGLGKTLLDDSKTLASLRSMNMFINSMAAAKNAITRRVLNVALDPAEKNPQKAEEIILSEFAKSTHAEYPLTNNPIDQINYLQMAGVQVQFEEHPRLPNTRVSVDYQDNNYKEINTDFDDWLKKMHTMALGLSPEVVEGAGNADFATQTIYANVMTARRIKILSDRFTASLSGFIRRFVFNSQILMDDLIDKIDKNGWKFKNQFGEPMTNEDVAILFVESLQVTLPTPDTTSLKEQSEAFEQMNDFYDKAINAFFSDEFINESELGSIGGEDVINRTKAWMKAYFLRDWMKANGVLPELFDLVAKQKDGKPSLDMLEKREEYMDLIAASILPMLKREAERKKKYDEAHQKFDDSAGDDYGSSGGNDYGDDTDDGEGGGDGFDTGDSDMGFDDLGDGSVDGDADSQDEQDTDEADVDSEDNESSDSAIDEKDEFE